MCCSHRNMDSNVQPKKKNIVRTEKTSMTKRPGNSLIKDGEESLLTSEFLRADLWQVRNDLEGKRYRQKKEHRTYFPNNKCSVSEQTCIVTDAHLNTTVIQTA